MQKVTASKWKQKSITDKVIQKEYIKKWNGQLPIISGSGATPIVDMGDLINPEG